MPHAEVRRDVRQARRAARARPGRPRRRARLVPGMQQAVPVAARARRARACAHGGEALHLRRVRHDLQARAEPGAPHQGGAQE